MNKTMSPEIVRDQKLLEDLQSIWKVLQKGGWTRSQLSMETGISYGTLNSYLRMDPKTRQHVLVKHGYALDEFVKKHLDKLPKRLFEEIKTVNTRAREIERAMDFHKLNENVLASAVGSTPREIHEYLNGLGPVKTTLHEHLVCWLATRAVMHALSRTRGAADYALAQISDETAKAIMLDWKGNARNQLIIKSYDEALKILEVLDIEELFPEEDVVIPPPKSLNLDENMSAPFDKAVYLNYAIRGERGYYLEYRELLPVPEGIEPNDLVSIVDSVVDGLSRAHLQENAEVSRLHEFLEVVR